MQLGTLLEALARLAPLDKAAVWDPVGLQIGDPASDTGRVVVCHEVTDAVLAAADDYAAGTIVSYHPLLFRPITGLVAGSDAGGRALRIANSGMNLIVLHTNVDAAFGAEELAVALGLGETAPWARMQTRESYKVITFCPSDAVSSLSESMAAAGAGVIGAYTDCSFRVAGVGTFYAGEGTDPAVGSRGEINEVVEMRLEMVVSARHLSAVLAALTRAHPYEEPAIDVYRTEGAVAFAGRVGTLPEAMPVDRFADHVGQVLDAAQVRVAGDGLVQRVAVVPGSGGDAIGEAEHVDAVVTGDVSHHRAVAAVDQGVAVIDPGHVPTERPGLAALYDAVDELVDECRLLPAREVWRP